ncbi:MAG: hypothetical protein K2Y10_03995 [Burkholderiaceae bacterium]|nr:hypothetical protein [Burkholderiaceae bacterium]
MPAAAPIARYGYAAANEAAWVNQTVRVNAGLNVGGQAIKVPAAMRLAANAPRFAAAAIFAHPGLRAAIGIASLLAAAKVMWDESKQMWVKTNETIQETDGKQYSVGYGYFSSPDKACQSGWPGESVSRHVQGSVCYADWTGMGAYGTVVTVVNRWQVSIVSRPAPCPSGWETTPAGCRLKSGSDSPLTTPEQLEPEIMKPKPWPNVPADWPMPSTVPNELPPGTPLPVEQPIINPTPGDNPKPQPYFVPTGNPVPNPNYDPNAAPSPQNQPYFQPGVRIVPSPTLDEPWRVDVQPVNRPTTSPTPKSTDELNPQPDPATNPAPATDPGKDDKAKPEEQQSLCEKHPEILACQKLDTPDAKELAKEDISISISPVAGWGSDTAACPTPRSVMLAGKEVSISWQPVCDFATGLRPLVIAMAWLSAVSMVIVVARRT